MSGAVVLSIATSGASATVARASASSTASRGHTLLQSRELWATVDVCNPSNQPDTVGVRGSMPSDGHAKDEMFMRFQLQYLEAKSNAWVDLHDGDSGYIAIGSAKIARQGGWSVQLKLVAGQPAYTIRGLVTFQWRRDGSAVHEAARTTGAGHKSLADADPPGYSAAQCVIG
jgi:hypothetical protein